MYKDNKILAVIPARGGSKGVPNKNIRLLAGKPLIAWTIEEARKSKYIDRLILSSESKEIIDIASYWGCETPFTRPSELSGDDMFSIEPFIHAINTLPEKYDYSILLQCTSPFRIAEDIDGVITTCINKGARSCISVCEVKKSPYKMQTVDNNGRLRPFVKGEPDKAFYPRQKLPKVFEMNGAVYMIKTDILLKTKKFYDDDTLAYVMNNENSLDLDNERDFTIAETIVNLRNQ